MTSFLNKIAEKAVPRCTLVILDAHDIFSLLKGIYIILLILGGSVYIIY